MSVSAHIQALKKKHDALENELEAAQATPAMDDLYIASLKRKKLSIRDEIETLKMQTA